ncbi:hypothetical protein IEQ34_011233 [Dendrobium chrysotoxum]|uniref:Uncharacterized protein n=1 Tax=Dendrobium chrysotoxum TaxID=161865 RepID=A0AAV7GWY2_DENCH|nr:hypothetical protein IEQ34_011233 [Dendrobium chrysotoxum]
MIQNLVRIGKLNSLQLLGGFMLKMRMALELVKKNLFEQLPFLKSLKLDGMPRVKWLENKFSGDDKYHAFPLLEKWFEAEVVAEDGCLFPCLIEWVLIKILFPSRQSYCKARMCASKRLASTETA